MPKTATPQQTYSLRGKVTQVYEPREIVLQYGNKKVTKEVTDLYLQLETGAKVKVSFWDTDVSHHDGASVVITHLAFKGKYNNIPQYSATKESQISASGKTKGAAPVAEGADLEEEPTFNGTPQQVVETPEGAEPTEETEEDATPEPVVTAKPIAQAVVAKKRTPKAATPIVSQYQVNETASAEITALAAEAVRIADHVANGLIKSEARSFTSFVDTIFINLSTKNFYANGGRAGH